MQFVIGFAAGVAACWFGKDWAVKKIVGVETFVRSLEDKAKALKAKL